MATANSNAFNVRVVVPTPLALAAAAMAPGSWAPFVCNYSTGTLAALLDVSNPPHRCTEYADKAVWDATRRQIYFTGGGHASQEKTIVYSDNTNTWTDLGSPPWYTVNPGGAVHGYQHNAFTGNTHYYLHFANTTVHTRNVDNGNASWGVLNTSGVSLGSDGAIGSLEWFPTFGSGSLIIIDFFGIYRWNGTSWSSLGQRAMGGYHNAGVYSPIKDLMYFGGGNGSGALYTMSNTGVMTAKASCPVEFGIIASVTTVDPVSGKLLVASKDRVIRVYDPTTNTWSTDTAPPPGFWSGNLYSEGDAMGIVAAPIYDYGVTMFITIGGPTIYLRKGR